MPILLSTALLTFNHVAERVDVLIHLYPHAGRVFLLAAHVQVVLLQVPGQVGCGYELSTLIMRVAVHEQA